MKKVFCKLAVYVLLAVVFANLYVPATAEQSRSGQLTDTISWELSDEGVLTISGTGAIPDYKILLNADVIPSWSDHIEEIEEIVVEEGITHIGAYTFSLYNGEYINLKKITLPSSLCAVGEHAFYSVYSVGTISPEVHIPTLEDWCEIDFYQDNRLPIPPEHGYYNTPLVLRGELFVGGKPLGEKPVLPQGMTEIKPLTFAHTKIREIVIPDSVTKIGAMAFEECYYLRSVQLPEGLTEISDHAFAFCFELEKIDLPEQLVHIGEWAFIDCKLFTEITFPKSLRYCGNGAFHGCEDIKAVHISDMDAYLGIRFEYKMWESNGRPGSNPLYYAKDLYLNGELVTEVKVPAYVVMISDYAFANCRSLTSIEAKGVFLIGDYSFYGCTALQTATFGTWVSEVGRSAFEDCENLTSATIPRWSIDSKAYAGCKSLTEVSLGNGIDYFYDVFEGCTGLQTVTLSDENTLQQQINEEHWLSGVRVVRVPKQMTPGEHFLDYFTLAGVKNEYAYYSTCQHNWNIQKYEYCRLDKSCSDCGIELHNVFEHTAGEWEITKKPTETNTGEKQCVCTVCGEVLETETLDALPPDTSDESSPEVSEESVEEISADSTESEESAELEESERSEELLQSQASEESVSQSVSDNVQNQDGVPVWVVVLLILLSAACGAGVTFFVTNKLDKRKNT